MPEVVFKTKGVNDVISGHKRVQKAGEDSAAVQIKKLADVLRSELKLRGERDKSAKKQETDMRRWERLITNAQRSQETGYERIRRKTKELSEAVKKTGADETLVSKERTRMILEYNREVDRSKSKIKDHRDSLQQTDKQASRTFDPTRLAKYAAGFIGVHKAVQLITNELQAQQGLVDKAEQRKMGIAPAEAELRANLLSLPISEQNRVIQQFYGIAQRQRMPAQPILLAGAQAVSGAGGDIRAALSTVEYLSPIFRTRPQAMGDVAQTLLNLSEVTGTLDPRINYGLLQQTATLSNIANARQQATNIGPALVGLGALGFTKGGAGALLSAMTLGGAERKGEMTGTAAIALGEKLREFDFGIEQLTEDLEDAREKLSDEEEKDARRRKTSSQKQASIERQKETTNIALRRAEEDFLVAKTEGSRRGAERRIADARRRLSDLDRQYQEIVTPIAGIAKYRTAVSGIETTIGQRQALLAQFQGLTGEERLMFLAMHPEFGQMLYGTGEGFEKKSRAVIRALLDPRSQTAGRFGRFLGEFSPEALAAVAARAPRAMQIGPSTQSAMFSQALESSLEAMQLREPLMVTGENRERFKELLMRTGESALGASIDDFLRGLSGGGAVTPERAIGALETRRARLLQGRPFGVGVTAGGFGVGGISPPTALDKENAAKLETAINTLREALERTQKEQIEATKETNRMLDRVGGFVGVAE